MSMSGLWQLPAKRFYGTIGYDVLMPFVVEIDYETRTIRLYDPARHLVIGQTFPAHMYGGYDPQIDGAIEVETQPPIPVRFTLDTGAGGTIVSSPLVESDRTRDGHTGQGRRRRGPDRGHSETGGNQDRLVRARKAPGRTVARQDGVARQ
jgi:hypothetical protein